MTTINHVYIHVTNITKSISSRSEMQHMMSVLINMSTYIERLVILKLFSAPIQIFHEIVKYFSFYAADDSI